VDFCLECCGKETALNWVLEIPTAGDLTVGCSVVELGCALVNSLEGF